MFDEEPLAAASTAQVHRATLHDGALVIVKVQRPNIVAQVGTDLRIMRRVARRLERSNAWAQQISLTSVVDQNQKTLFTNAFDSVNRVITQTDALGKTITVAYNTPSVGITQVTDPNGGVASYYYDLTHRTTDKVDPLGHDVTNIYDSSGNLQKIIDPANNAYQCAYDANGLPTSTTDPLNNAAQTAQRDALLVHGQRPAARAQPGHPGQNPSVHLLPGQTASGRAQPDHRLPARSVGRGQQVLALGHEPPPQRANPPLAGERAAEELEVRVGDRLRQELGRIVQDMPAQIRLEIGGRRGGNRIDHDVRGACRRGAAAHGDGHGVRSRISGRGIGARRVLIRR